MEMAETEINAVVDGFAAAAALARRSGLHGVEINVGQYSLLRQFASGLTNQRTDAYGQDRLLLTERVLRSVRTALGRDRVLGLRLCCDELAPWAGVTPSWPRSRPHGWPGRSTISWWCAGRSTRCRPPGPTCTPSRASALSSAVRSARQ